MWKVPFVLSLALAISFSASAQTPNSKLEKILEFMKANVFGKTVSPAEAVKAIEGAKGALHEIEYERSLTFSQPLEIRKQEGEVVAVVFSTDEDITRTIVPVDEEGKRKPKAKTKKTHQSLTHRYELLKGTAEKEEFVYGFVQTVEDSEGEVGDTFGITANFDGESIRFEGALNFDESTKVSVDDDQTFPISIATKIDLKTTREDGLVMDQTFLFNALKEKETDPNVFESKPFVTVTTDPKDGRKETPMTPVLVHSTEDIDGEEGK